MAHQGDQPLPAKRLAAFLRGCKSSRGGAYTHTSICNPCGCFYVPPTAAQEFMALYKAAVASGDINLHLTEKHTDVGPIVIDLDFRFSTDDSAAEGEPAEAASSDPPQENEGVVEGEGEAVGGLSRRYTQATVSDIVMIYSDLISAYIEGLDHFDVFVLEKPAPVMGKNNNFVKDGVHIVIPEVVTTPGFQFLMREHALPLVKNALAHLRLQNKTSDVLDEAVIEKNNWQMLGSRKAADAERYRVTRIVRYHVARVSGAGMEGKLEDLPVALEDVEYIERLSIRNKVRATKVRADKVEEVRTVEQRLQTAKLKQHFKSTIITKVKDMRTNEQTEEDFKQAQALVALLGKERAETYNDWIRVGWCLRNIDHKLLQDWIGFSRQSTKFKDGDCEKLWNYMRTDSSCLGMGTLHLWAKMDNSAAYAKLVGDELRSLIRESCNGSEYDVARVIQRKYGNTFAYDSGNKVWYHFKDHRWHHTPDGMALKSRLPDHVATEYRKAASHYITIASQTEDAAQRNTYDELATKLQGIVHKLKKAAFQAAVMTECAMLFNHEKFEEKLDSNMHLVGFNNGVFDLHAMEFREGRPEDHVSLTTRINYVPLEDQPSEAVDEVMDFFSKVVPNENVRAYVLRLFSSFLHGHIREERFNVWTGSGSNGKSRAIELYQKAFGDYCCTLPIALLTQKRGSSSSATPELARAKAKRFACLQEPGENERLNIGLMKEMTGGDKLYARALYREGCEFKPQFKMILTCNHLPLVPSDDGGTWRRIRVVQFESRFCDNPDPDNPKEFPIDTSLSERFDEWAEVFMSILIEIHRKLVMVRYKEPEPIEVTECTREYQRRNDVMADFMDNCVHKDVEGATMLVDHAYSDFKIWLKDEGMADRGMRKSDFLVFMERRLGKPSTINRAKGWRGFKLKSLADAQGDGCTEASGGLDCEFA